MWLNARRLYSAEQVAFWLGFILIQNQAKSKSLLRGKTVLLRKKCLQYYFLSLSSKSYLPWVMRFLILLKYLYLRFSWSYIFVHILTLTHSQKSWETNESKKIYLKDRLIDLLIKAEWKQHLIIVLRNAKDFSYWIQASPLSLTIIGQI